MALELSRRLPRAETCIVDRISIRTRSMLIMHLHTPPAKFVRAQSLRTLQPLKNEYSTCQIREGSKPQKYSIAKTVKAPILGSTWQKQKGQCWSSGDLYTHNMPKISTCRANRCSIQVNLFRQPNVTHGTCGKTFGPLT